MTARPPPDELMAIGLFIYEFGELERVVDNALAESVAIVRSINPSERVPREFKERVQKLLTFHRTRLPMKTFRSRVEPLLLELRDLLLLMRNDVAHGRFDEYQHDILVGAERAVVLKERWRCVAN
jgi:hypothetical protein